MKKRKKVLLERLTAEGRRELEQRLDSGGASSKRKRKKWRKRRTPRPSRFHRCSSWTIYWPVVCNDRFSGPGAVLGQVLTCPLLCLTGEVGPDSTKNRGIAAVAVLRGG